MVATDPGEGGAAAGRYRFGDIMVDAAAHTLSRAGELQAVEPKSFAVLLALLQRPGELIARDDLLDRVWGHRHVTPGVLTRAIAQLRHALDDDSQRPRYIQTQHAVGYRFVGVLEADRSPAADAQQQEAETLAPPANAASLNETGSGDSSVLDRRTGSPDRFDTSADFATAATPGTPPRASRTLWILGAGFAAVVIAAWLLARNAPPPRPEASIAVLPFTTLSSNRRDDYFAEGLAVEMHDALAGVQGLKVAARMTPTVADRGDPDIKAIGEQLGVATVLDASVRREGSRVRINARLSDCTTGYTLWSHIYDRQLSDVFATQSEIARQVVKELVGVLPDDGRALTRRLSPTRSFAAYEAYLKGIDELRRAGDGGNMDVAASFFSEALAADHGFARAQAGICRAELVRFEGKRDAAIFERAEVACLLASRMDPQLHEVHLALGDLHRIGGNLDKAIEHYAKVQKDPALRPAAYVGIGRVRSAQGRHDQALRYFEHARALKPRDADIHRAIGFQHYIDENLTKAIESFREATSIEPGNASAWSSLGGLHLAAGDTTAAGHAFEQSIRIEPTAVGLTNLGALRYATGAYAEAADLFRRAVALEPGDFRLWGNLGEAMLEIPGGAKQAREPFLHAIELAERYVLIKPDDAQALALLAWYRAGIGDAAAARGMAVRAESLGTERGEVALRNAQTFATLGDVTAARERLVRAQEAGIPKDRITTTPILRSLAATGNREVAASRQ